MLYYHPAKYFLVSNLCDIFAAAIRKDSVISQLINVPLNSYTLEKLIYHGVTIANS